MVNPADFLAQRKDGSWQLNIYISPENAQAVSTALAIINKEHVLRTGLSVAKSQAVVNAILSYAQAIEAQSQQQDFQTKKN